MKVLVRELAKSKGTEWQVSLDQHAVCFRSEAEARAFVATLETRLRAPHILPRHQQHATG